MARKGRIGGGVPPDPTVLTAVLPEAVVGCLPEHLHPVSRVFLEYWLSGEMSTAEFLHWFHMPNSDYLPVVQCILSAMTG